VNVTGSVSYPSAGFGKRSVEPRSCATRELVHIYLVI